MDDRHIVLGSDGLFDLLSSHQVAEAVAHDPSSTSLLDTALQVLAKRHLTTLRQVKENRWMKKHFKTRRHFHDDISCLIITV